MKRLFSIAAALILALFLHATAASSADWQQEWDKTVAAAKSEGQITLSIPAGSVWQSELMRFQEAYPGIKVTATSFSGRDFWARFLKEREVGQYLWDMRIGGYDAQEYQIKQAGNMQPVRDLFLLPEVTDDSKWHQGLDGSFLDREKKFIFSFVGVDQTTARYNTKVIPKQLTADDLVDPQWSGKISMADPRGGASLNGMGGLIRTHGYDFVKKLVVDQKPVITNVPRQQLEWLVSGRYPIAFGLPSATSVEYARNGGDVSMMSNMSGALQSSMGVGGIAVPTKNPHPNATKVFVNWLLSKDVQTHIMERVRLNSRRTDVPIFSPDLALDYNRINEYFRPQGEEAKQYLDEVKKILAANGGR
jgi:iron(III) transport system substrate-binding protein